MSFVYDSFKNKMNSSGVNLSWDDNSVDLYMMLVSGSSTTSNDDDFESDVTTFEVVHGSYSRQQVTGADNPAVTGSRTITTQIASNRAEYDAVDVTFSSLDVVVVGGAIIFNSGGGTPATNDLICYLSGADFPKTANGGDFTIQFSTTGVFMVTGA